jgi:hypothetical protein
MKWFEGMAPVNKYLFADFNFNDNKSSLYSFVVWNNLKDIRVVVNKCLWVADFNSTD